MARILTIGVLTEDIVNTVKPTPMKIQRYARPIIIVAWVAMRRIQ